MLSTVDTLHLAENEFITHEIRMWGFDKVESLLEDGFEPKLTTKGWSWIMPVGKVRQRIAA